MADINDPGGLSAAAVTDPGQVIVATDSPGPTTAAASSPPDHLWLQ